MQMPYDTYLNPIGIPTLCHTVEFYNLLTTTFYPIFHRLVVGHNHVCPIMGTLSCYALTVSRNTKKINPHLTLRNVTLQFQTFI